MVGTPLIAVPSSTDVTGAIKLGIAAALDVDIDVVSVKEKC